MAAATVRRFLVAGLLAALVTPVGVAARADVPVGVTLTLAVTPGTVVYGAQLTLTGTLARADGSPVAAAPVQVLARTAGQSAVVVAATAATGATGGLTVLITPRTTAEYQLRYAGNAATLAGLSNKVVSAVQPRITASLSPAGIKLGQSAVLSGTTAPAYLGSTVTIRRRMPDGSWRNLAAVRVATTGAYSWRVTPGLVGTYRFSALLPAHPAHLAAASPLRTLQVDPRDLRRGDTGGDVVTLQRRLAAQRMDVGAIDGVFGYNLQHAVIAFQKAQGLPRTGIYDSATRQRLGAPLAIRLRYPASGRAVEIDLRKQVLYLSFGGVLQRVVDVSTGSGGLYYQDGAWHRATTPIGRFAITWKINDPNHTSPLGVLYRPAFFYRGYAIHGSSSVPTYPASHGCVRVTTHVQDGLYNLLTVGTPVAIY